MAQELVSVRVDSEVKKQVALLAEDLGMNTSTAVSIFLRAFLRTGGMPFDVKMGNENPEERALLQERIAKANDPATQWEMVGQAVAAVRGSRE